MRYEKLKEQAINKKCTICNKEITKNDYEKNDIIAVISKRKTKNFAHKTCLIRR